MHLSVLRGLRDDAHSPPRSPTDADLADRLLRRGPQVSLMGSPQYTPQKLPAEGFASPGTLMQWALRTFDIADVVSALL